MDHFKQALVKNLNPCYLSMMYLPMQTKIVDKNQ